MTKKSNPLRIDPLSLPTLDLNRRYDAVVASAYLMQCLATTRKQIANGTLESFVVGRKRYISGRTIAAQAQGPGKSAAARQKSA